MTDKISITICGDGGCGEDCPIVTDCAQLAVAQCYVSMLVLMFFLHRQVIDHTALGPLAMDA